MAKRKRSGSEAVTGEIPDEMIQHIQSYLGEKEAAQTSILSKSWYNAWLTRPNLVFNESDFKGSDTSKSKRLSQLLVKTMQRYRHLNLKIDSFKLWMQSSRNVGRLLANKLVEAIKMGATDITFQLCFETTKFVLPRDILESESLIRLRVAGCKMKGAKVNCSRLKHLSLCRVYLEGDLIWDIILRCPLIEGLELRQCKSLWVNRRNTQVNLSNNLFELHMLKTLVLKKVKICSLFFSDFSSRFPCLKDLRVHECSGYKNIQIHSQSLEFISFVHERVKLKAEFDVPNLRKFCFSGKKLLPALLFPNSCDWESNISVSYCDNLNAKWFTNLNQLLMNLCLSKVSLSLRNLRNIDDAGNTRCLPKPSVEKLNIDYVKCSDSAALLGSLFQWCCPVNVTLYYWSLVDGKGGMESVEILYKKLMQQDGVEKVSVSDMADRGWQKLSRKALLDASTRRSGRVGIRFHVRNSAAKV